MSTLDRGEIGRRTRATIIDIARRRQRPGTGSRLTANDEPARIWPDLSGVLEGLPWAVAGAVATRRYMPERATGDLDVVVLARHARDVERRLVAAGYSREGPPAIGGAEWRSSGGVRVDIIEGAEPWWEEALAHPQRDRQGLPVLALPYLALMKLLASRTIDIGDVARMLGLASDAELADVRAVIARLAPELAADLESLIALGRLEQS